MKELMEWLEGDSLRTRKLIAMITTFVWVFVVIAAMVLKYYKYDILSILTIVTAQFATVVGFYMVSNANSDKE